MLNSSCEFARRVCSAVLLLALVAATSCSRSDRVAGYPVEGVARCQGQPAAGALIVFHPKDAPKDVQKLLPTATVDADGRFSLSTYEPFDGAPAGSYRVTVTWPSLVNGEARGTDRLGGRYSKAAQSPLAATVREGDNQLQPFNL